MNTLERVRQKAVTFWKNAGLMDAIIQVTAAPLSVEQAIGRPEGQDFPIQKGKEKLMQADFQGAKGQAFTDTYGNYQGTLAEVASLNLQDARLRPVFVATLNAVTRFLDQTQYTIHCKDKGPQECAGQIAIYVATHYGSPKIGLVGYQPALINALSNGFSLRVLDLDPDNINQVRYGVLIEDGAATNSVLQWADLLLVTGTTLVNGTIDMFLTNTPVVFYGTTIAAAASLMGWERFCPCSS